MLDTNLFFCKMLLMTHVNFVSFYLMFFFLFNSKVIPMGGQDDDLIPSVFIGASHGKQLLNHFTFEKNPNIRIILTDDEPFDINAYLLPFAIVVGICFVIMLGIVIYKCIQDHR